MDKEYISYGEVLYFFITYVIVAEIVWTLYCYISLMPNKWIALFLFGPYLIFGVYFICQSFYSKKYLCLPAKCILNPLGYIELHIGNENKNNRSKFFKLCAEAIFKARNMNKDVLCDTWIVPPDKMKEKFGDAIVVKKISLLQKIQNLENKFRYNGEKLLTDECYRYVIKTNKLTEKEIIRLEQLIKKQAK